MAGIELEKGKIIYKCDQPMTALHLISKGKVQVSYPGGSYVLNKGDVIGVCELTYEVHFLTYTTLEDTTLLTYPYANLSTLEDILKKHPDVARLFLLSAFRQLNTLQERCALSETNCSQLYHDLNEDINLYNILCNRYRQTVRTLSGTEELSAYISEESADLWLNSYYQGLQQIFMSETARAFVQDAAVSMGFLRKCSLDFRKAYSSLDEQYQYVQQVANFYFNESSNDLFDFYTSLLYKMGQGTADTEEVFATINRFIKSFQNNCDMNKEILEKRINTFKSSIDKLATSTATSPATEEEDVNLPADLIGSLNTILDFAGLDLDLADAFRQHVTAYKAVEDKASSEDDINRLRRTLTSEFYNLYSVTFERTLSTKSIPMPVKMFLLFGYVDEELAGAKNCIALYSIAENMHDYTSAGLYTFYDWLMAIYNGKREPSRNEFDQDYSDFIHKQKVNGNITDQELRDLESNVMGKIRFELDNLFQSANKITNGHITTFCPLFAADNVMKDLRSSYVTVDQVGKAFEMIRKIDYSAFYRESLDYDNIDIMGKEMIHLEFLPDVILMPNVGVRGAMWQECEGKRRNTPGRMFFSIFHMEDLTTSLIRMTGEFRWEMCKRVQGGRWNDVSEPSLTSEYFDYIQFYRKNHDLTSEAKERVRTSLQHAKNSFKEMFVRDYILWIMFEGNGSPRLNKVARKILFTYCPFPADICEQLQQNPLYGDLLNPYAIKKAQKLHHIDVLLKKLRNSGTKLPDTLEKERAFIEGKV